MYYHTIDIYNNFKCIAGSCPNTCCAGWEVMIDEETYQKMREHEKELGILAKDWLYESHGCILAKLENLRCTMLDNNNLCKVVCTLGPEYLSDICRRYPREYRIYGNLVEASLSSSCPVVIDILQNKEEIHFDFSDDEDTSFSYPYSQLYLFESTIRSNIVDILQCFPTTSLHTRLFVSYKILENGITLYQQNQLNSDLATEYANRYFSPEIMCSLDSQLSQLIDDSKRFHFFKNLHTLLHDLSFSHEHFSQLAAETCNYFLHTDFKQYMEDLASFRTTAQNYHMFYTNYWVYRIFTEMIRIPDYEHVTENFLYIAAELCLTQLIALATFAHTPTPGQIDYPFITSCINRTFERNSDFRKKTICKLQENDVVNAAGLLLMTLI